MQKTVLKGHIVVPAADLSEVKSAMMKHITLTQNEAGCLAFEINPRIDDDTIFDVYEVFEDLTAFKLHQERVKNSVWGQLTKNVQRHYTLSQEVD